MKKRIIAIGLMFALVCSGMLFFPEIANEIKEVKADSITVHFKWSGETPHLYYENIDESEEKVMSYPGVPMREGKDGWYEYTIEKVQKADLVITVPTASYQTAKLTRESGDWWFSQGAWYAVNPDTISSTSGEGAETANTVGINSQNTQSNENTELVQINQTEQIQQVNANESTITIHYYCKDQVPNIYYWNALPENKEVNWPGAPMQKDTSTTKDGWYTYTFTGVTKINLLFQYGDYQTEDLTQTTGEWWYNGKKWYNKNPDEIVVEPVKNNDFRDETIYFLMTARFYDGDSSNNVHCIDDSKAGNPDSDPAWRGDFKGVIEKLDYIKALGFSAVWLTPVVENASSYDFHGYHAINFKKIDPRLESNDADYQTLINECHKRGMKIIQDVVFNHTSNNGEEGLFPIMRQEYKLGNGVTGNSTTMVKDDRKGVLPSDYDSLNPTLQYQARDSAMKAEDYAYRKKVDIGWEDFTVTTGQFAGDCMELNTENPFVYNYLVDAYNGYIDMGVDAFRIDTVKHISRLTFNSVFLPSFKEKALANGNENFYMFGEIACRVSEVFNHGVPQVSPPYYTWNEEKEWNWNYSSVDGKDNLELAKSAYNVCSKDQSQQRTSDNAFLKGNEYHKPDYTESSGMGVIDYAMHFNFEYASKAYNIGLQEDKYMNDSTYNVTYVDSHDYGPSIDGRSSQNGSDVWRYAGGTEAWAENLNLLFTFRGIPCLYYGSEVEFQKGAETDIGATGPLSTTGRAYFGDYLEGTVSTSDFGVYSNATGKLGETLNNPLAKHIQRLNRIRRAIPALRKGQYSTENVEGGMAFKRRFTDEETDSFVCVAITNGATFKGLPGGTYKDAITGDTQTISEGGTLTISAPGKGNMRVYVLDTAKTDAPGKIGETQTYLK